MILSNKPVRNILPYSFISKTLNLFLIVFNRLPLIPIHACLEERACSIYARV